jgi:hypothetical protein
MLGGTRTKLDHPNTKPDGVADVHMHIIPEFIEISLFQAHHGDALTGRHFQGRCILFFRRIQQSSEIGHPDETSRDVRRHGKSFFVPLKNAPFSRMSSSMRFTPFSWQWFILSALNHYPSALVGSMIRLTSEIVLAGKPPSFACFSINSLSGAI